MNILASATFWERFWHADFWYAVPLIVALSLVYAATRHEELKKIFRHALRLGGIIVIFMAAIFAILWFFSRGL
jgi:multisubunit Na+/H+ antiporter MnhB subunit